ncbi:MAG: polysaccharide biosynthesis protein [Leptospiraceae bacterium]|nr:polysaccharide biosynthesis protein [Leptospiraceae bacterium]
MSPRLLLSSNIPKFKVPIVMAVDALIAAVSMMAAFQLRLEGQVVELMTVSHVLQSVIVAVIVQMTVFWFSGLYRGIWRFSSIPDLTRILVGTMLGVSATGLAIFLINRLENVPRSIFIIDWLLLVVGLGGVRFGYRVLRDSLKPSTGEKAIIVGAGRAGEQLFREFKNNPALNIGVVGFIDDEPALKGKYLHGVPVFGGIPRLPDVIRMTEASEILIAIPAIDNKRIRQIVDLCADLGVGVKRLPDLSSFVTGKVIATQLKSVSPEDLLGRPPVQLNRQAMAEMLAGKRVLVTGAGGSIGGELCRQIVAFQPASLILAEVTELFLYEIEREMAELAPRLPVTYLIHDVRNRKGVERIFRDHRPEVVFHAAAYKHVPLMEENPWQAIENNVGGTRNVASAAGSFGAERFVLVSTDKAVNPTNVMGATKRICEMVCTDLQSDFPETRYIAVRFGNVLGSTGSVIPLFQKQIESGGPVTVTHPDVRRYFMSIPEAVQLVMQAAAMGAGGEVFVLEMGDPVRIVDLAREMIALSGFIPDREIRIVFTGLRPGEKLYEELLTDAESTVATSHPGVRIARLSRNSVDFRDRLDSLLKTGAATSRKDLMEQLRGVVPEYGPAIEANRKRLRLIQ